MNNMVEHPKHYKLEGIKEVLDVIRYALSKEEYMGFLKGNVIKYTLRAPYKGESQQDWNKASYYMNLVEKYGKEYDEEDQEDEDEEVNRMVDYLDDYIDHYIRCAHEYTDCNPRTRTGHAECSCKNRPSEY